MIMPLGLVNFYSLNIKTRSKNIVHEEAVAKEGWLAVPTPFQIHQKVQAMS